MRPPITRLVASGIGMHARWGRLDVTPVSTARNIRAMNAAIVVYAPGTTRAESFWLSVRGLPTTWIGAGGAIVLIVLSSIAQRIWPGGVIATAVLLLVWLIACSASWKAHRGVRRVRAGFTPGGASGDLAQFEKVANELDALDTDPPDDPVEYEMRWALIYDQVAKTENDR